MANSSSRISNVKNILQLLENTLEFAQHQLTEDSPNREDVDFDLTNFWTNFSGVVKLISHEATKFCMIFNEGEIPTTEGCQALTDKIEKTCLSLLAVFVTLPKTRGKFFYREIHKYVIDTFQGMKNLTAAIRTESSSRLQMVGDIWEHCERVERLPRDNKDAVLNICREQHDMVQDASQELMDAMENEDDEAFDFSLLSPPNGIQLPAPQRWTESDRNVLLSCSGLVKASKACVKKTAQAISARGDGAHEDSIHELDGIAEIVGNSSSLVDDFVLSLYAPMNHSAVREQAALLRNNAKELLSSVRNSHFCGPNDETWIDFLEKAVDHNWVRTSDMVLVD